MKCNAIACCLLLLMPPATAFAEGEILPLGSRDSRVVDITTPQNIERRFEVKSWRKQATRYLHTVDEDGVAIPLEESSLEGISGFRCTRINNYYCIKQRSNCRTKWPNSIGRDSQCHAIMADGAHSVAMAVRVLRTYYFSKRPLKTLREIMCKYAPPSDCIGGNCQLGKNDCDRYAEAVALEAGISPDVDAKLFNAQGVPQYKVLIAVLRKISNFELSDQGVKLYPRTRMIRAGIAQEMALPK